MSLLDPGLYFSFSSLGPSFPRHLFAMANVYYGMEKHDKAQGYQSQAAHPAWLLCLEMLMYVSCRAEREAGCARKTVVIDPL